jgi:hypothetical protein
MGQKWPEIENHQPRSRVVAWVLKKMVNPLDQAPFPARVIGMLIRIDGIGRCAIAGQERLVIKRQRIIGLKAVDQTVGWRVKKAGDSA